MSDTSRRSRRGVVKLIVASPDGSRVLARPNGLAGWTLPAIPAPVPLETWTEDASRLAESLLGTTVEPVRQLGADAWAVTATGRVPSAGHTWIGVDEAARLGADEAVLRRWSTGTPTP